MACCPILPLLLPSCLRHASRRRCRRLPNIGLPSLLSVVIPGSRQRIIDVALACEAIVRTKREAQWTTVFWHGWPGSGSTTGDQHKANTAFPGRHSTQLLQRLPLRRQAAKLAAACLEAGELTCSYVRRHCWHRDCKAGAVRGDTTISKQEAAAAGRSRQLGTAR